ncbi:hypothetical protein CHO01_34760 [Cellulomonas hominis]|uniref:Uncharacterized protein n=1 Tax=Cellulomonas hominis TaxID=156981 RepID=A0A511FGL3_9CELL|nr:hypothetical protein [Cellulomonas hominis]MBB5473072.1 hypothetical protein [Cellulomonas hominis]GEL48360.1 hypothetical protein CHO01_34760 [Cellulomonas hominis]
MVLPALPDAPAATGGVTPPPGRHLLVLPDGVAPDEVEVLAASRFPSARWERPPRIPSGRRASGAARGPAPQATPGVLRVGRLSTLTGPYAVEPEQVARWGLPTDSEVAWVVDCPRERAEQPPFGGDRDGLRRAFGTSGPVREEGRVVQWLVAAARRLGGAVRVESGIVLEPDMDAALDLTVLTDRWVEPRTVLAAARRVEPRARLEGDPVGAPDAAPDAAGPALAGAALAAREEAGVGIADVAERRRLHAEADAFDAHMRAHPPASEAFGVQIDLGVDGIVVVEVAAELDVPVVLAALDWAQGEVVAYRVRWEAPDVEQLESERPSLPHRVARGRAARVVRGVAREVHAEVGGEIADMAGFLVDPGDL